MNNIKINDIRNKALKIWLYTAAAIALLGWVIAPIAEHYPQDKINYEYALYMRSSEQAGYDHIRTIVLHETKYNDGPGTRLFLFVSSLPALFWFLREGKRAEDQATRAQKIN